MSYGPNPWQQRHWDWRAAANFMCGGLGSGLIVATALAGGPAWLHGAGALLVAAGLAAVWFEIGRPWRALNVLLNPRRSWMSREALLAPPLLVAAVAAATGMPGAAAAAALLALAFAGCQGCILRAARGIPAWREPLVVPLIVATGLAEGAGLWLLATGPRGLGPLSLWGLFAGALLARLLLWTLWRARITAAARALATIDRAGHAFKAATLLPLAMAVIATLAPLPPEAAGLLQALAGAIAAAGGLWFKFTLVTRAAFNQGFALPHLPVRGVRRRET
ncbi:MAG: hypothetical protein Q8R98_07175 [Rubrivivax sp.]|nr:hypothetical protein [Rubrivivax sp.]MDP3611616.1 hypothetical protein [Rubrivivax sp.]